MGANFAFVAAVIVGGLLLLSGVYAWLFILKQLARWRSRLAFGVVFVAVYLLSAWIMQRAGWGGETPASRQAADMIQAIAAVLAGFWVARRIDIRADGPRREWPRRPDPSS